MINESQVSFYPGGGHNHDGENSSLINTSIYSVYDFPVQIVGDPDRTADQIRNLDSFKQLIIDTVNQSIIAPSGIVFQEGMINGSAHIISRSIEATSIATGTLTANEISAETITSDLLVSNFVLVNNIISSNNYVTGVSGWAISSDGSAEFDIAVIRGTIIANSIVANATITSPVITGGTIDIGGNDSTSFHVDADGNIWLGAATYAAAPFKVSNAGAFSATSGTISGNLISGGTVSGTSININSGVFQVTSAGALTATGANITGTIVASSGYIGSWQIVGGNIIGTGSTNGIPTILDEDGNNQFGNNVDVGGKVTAYRSAEDALYAINGGLTTDTTARIRGIGIAFEGSNIIASGNYMGLRWSSPNIYGTVDNAVSAILGTVSDIRFKIDIQDLDDTYVGKILDNVKVVEYTPVDLLNNNKVSSVRNVGIVAQHLLEIMPELVTYDQSNPDAYMSTNYLGFVPHLVKVVQRLNDRIKALESPTP